MHQDVAGAVTQIAGTIQEPSWVLRGDVCYVVGPLRLTYEANYLPSSLSGKGANATNAAYPVIDDNLRHNISGLYDFGHVELRAAINNLTNKFPSTPTCSTATTPVGRSLRD